MAKEPIRCKCGSNTFYKSLRTGGWWTQIIEGDGEVVDTCVDSVRTGPEPKTVVCTECGRRVPNPCYNPDSL